MILMKIQTSDFPIRKKAKSPKSGIGLSVSLILTGLTVASGFLAIVWGFGFTPLASTPKTLSAATKPKPGEKTDESDAPVKAQEKTAEKRIKLNYFSAAWPKVFQDLSETFEMEFISDHVPRGRFSRRDKSEYTRKEALRIINKEIEEQGLRLIEKGQYLILLETTLQRPQYPPAVLPKKSKPKPSDEDRGDSITSNGVRGETRARNGGVDRAVYHEDVADKSIRYGSNKSRQNGNDRESDSDRGLGARKVSGARSIRQASLEEAEDDSEVGSSRTRRSIGTTVPTELENVGAAAQHVSYRARNVRAVDLSKRVYRALKSEAELVDSGRNGLPAFRVVSAQFSSNGSQSSKGGPSRPIEFMVSIDEARNELLIDGNEKSVDAMMKLLRMIDKPDNEQTRTQIKPSTKYVCQIADQLPAEIERLRAANGTKAIARFPVNGQPLTNADEDQKKVPLTAQNDPPLPKEPANRPDRPIGDMIGNFKGEVNIEVIEDLNVMIIRGNERDVEQIMKVIQQIEDLSEATAPQVHLKPLNNVDSESLAELLTSVYEKLTKFPGRATQPREAVAIIPVSKPNALLIVAPEAELESILNFADELDKPVDPQTEFQVFQLKSAVAADVEVLITDFYKERKALGAKVLVIADARSNSVLVRARPRDLDEIKDLINKMDRDEVGAVNQVKIFTLKNAVATEMAAVINSAIQSVLSPPRATTGGAGGQGGNAGLGGGQVDEQFKSVKAAALQFLSVEKGGMSRNLRSGVLSDIRVTPEAHTNSLIVTASERSMDLVGALIQTLDRPTTTVSVIKVFTLDNADAQQMVQQLNALFNNQPQGLGNQQRPLLGGIALANADDSSSSLVPLKFSVDARTNSVIAVGSADAMRVVEAILLRLDDSNLRARKNEVVRLNNAPATLIATAVTQFFQQQRDIAQNDPNLVSNVEQMEREVIVIPDTVSNNLLVSSTPRYFPDILAMIKKLDSEPKQVVIQALIVEVQLNNTDEFGIELGLQSPVLFDRSLKQAPVVQTTTNTTGQLQTTSQTLLSQEGTPGFNFNNPGVPLGNNILASAATVAGQSLTNFSVGRTNSQLGYGGLVLSAGSNSVNALLRALSSKTKIQILSRPQIRTLDSLLAEVFVGQTIPTVTSFQTNATTGVISPTLTQRETGIGMQVTPRINQEGNVVINLYAYRSQLSQQTVNVTTDSRGQPVGQRITDLSNIRTTVLVPTNSTIVIGGMISSRDEAQVRKAPYLADIPVLGHLFRFDSRTTIRSELLIFLTPRVVNGPDEEECLKEIEMGRLHFIESEAEEAHGPLRALPAPDELFEDEHRPWIGPDVVPPSPILPAQPSSPQPSGPPTPSKAPASNTPGPSPAATPTSVPPSPISPPPAPDPNVTRINALRALATESDDSPGEKISPANYTVPAKDKRRIFNQKRPTQTAEKE